MKRILPKAQHKQFRNEAIVLLRKHAGHLQSDEMLALSAHLVGQIIAMQDQRKISRDAALQIVLSNIEAGNQEAVANLMAAQGST